MQHIFCFKNQIMNTYDTIGKEKQIFTKAFGFCYHSDNQLVPSPWKLFLRNMRSSIHKGI